jgi:very-short-patch-repair endonuclease/predicted transcriptional regulator of viral defense system
VSIARNVSDEYGAKSAVGRERGLSALATRQHGVVALWQLLALGFSARAVGRRVESGRLHRLHRGVYAVGHRRITQRGRWMAAVFACGPGALLSHRSAAHLRDLRSWSPGIVEVVTAQKVRRRPGIRPYLTSFLNAGDRDIVDTIPCTSLACTLLGLAAVDPESLDGAVAAAEQRSILDLGAVDELLRRAPRRAGVRALRKALVGITAEFAWTRSELERRFLALCRQATVPRPRVNAWIEVPGDGFEVDFSWPELRLIVETDGHGSHGDRRAFEEDRRRDQLLVAAGWRVVRFTWHQVFDDPASVVAVLRTLSRGVNNL